MKFWKILILLLILLALPYTVTLKGEDLSHHQSIAHSADNIIQDK